MSSPLKDGDPNSKLLIVGMAPGSDELAAGRPFVGASGKLLWSCGKRAGFSRADAYILNTIGEVQELATGPSPAQLDAYWAEFDAAVAESKATAALCLGGAAFRRLTGNADSIMSSRGYVFPTDAFGTRTRVRIEQIPYKSKAKKYEGKTKPRKVTETAQVTLPSTLQWVVPAYHPSYVLHLGFRPVSILARDVDRAWRMATGGCPLAAASYGVTPQIIDDPVLSIDIETLASIDGRPVLDRVGVSCGVITWTAPWNYETGLALQACIERAKVLVFHNASFDVPILEENGIRGMRSRLIWDTMLAAQLREPDLSKGLNTVASMYLDLARWKHTAAVSPESYNANDCFYTHKLYFRLGEVLDASAQRGLFERSIMPALPVLMDLHRYGIAVNLETQAALRAGYQEKLYRLGGDWQQLHPGVSWRSQVQVKKLFYETLGWTPQKGKDKKISVDETALDKLKTHDPQSAQSVDLLLALRSALKDLSTFVEVLLDNRYGHATTHPSYLPVLKDDEGLATAGTGRIQARSPNIMQVPKHIRKMYVPHSRGNVFVEADFDQAELRVVAALSGDRNLNRRLDEPDIHRVHASAWGTDRATAKTVTYGTLYGAGPRKLQQAGAAKGTRKSVSEWERHQRQFFADYPGVVEYRGRILNEIQLHRRLVNPFGRARYFWNPASDAPAAFDFPPQSTVADISWTLLPKLWDLALEHGGKLITLVHDSFLFELPEHQFFVGAARIVQLLQTKFDCVCPGFYLPATVKYGPSWGELSEFPVGSLRLELESA